MKLSKLTSTLFATLLFFIASGFTSNEKAIKATEWKIDSVHSNITFEVSHFFTPVQGAFKKYDSQIYFSPENLEESSVNIDIQVSSIDTDNQKRDGHLQSPDFFNAEKYPTISFKSDRITKEGDNKFIAHGKLTIKDVTKDVKLPFTLLGVKDHPMKENTKVAGMKIDYSIDRTDFKVGTGDWAATAVVGDNVDISIALELNSVN
ncbi:MAG: YceI family protein [Balneolaceae bacterium]|nr:YceI family protein [Balneolaceae bacterium]